MTSLKVLTTVGVHVCVKRHPLERYVLPSLVFLHFPVIFSFILSVSLCWGQLLSSFSDGSVFLPLFLPREKLGITPSELVLECR